MIWEATPELAKEKRQMGWKAGLRADGGVGGSRIWAKAVGGGGGRD